MVNMGKYWWYNDNASSGFLLEPRHLLSRWGFGTNASEGNDLRLIHRIGDLLQDLHISISYFPRTFNDPLKLSCSILGSMISMMVYAKLRSIQSATDHVDVSWRPHRRSMSRAWHLYHLPHQISWAPDMASVQVTMLAPDVVSCGIWLLGSWAAT